MPVPSSTDKNIHYGKFATTSRLIACLVTEGLVKAYLVPSSSSEDIVGACLVMRQTPHDDKLLVAVPLHGLPELNQKEHLVRNGIRCPRIELVDPWDMVPFIYAPSSKKDASVVAPLPALQPASGAALKSITNLLSSVNVLSSDNTLVDNYDAVQLWEQFAQDYGVATDLIELISSELASSIEHQIYTYDHPKPLPTLDSPAIHWEQSIVEGHATHPMHKARRSYAPLPPLNPGEVNLDRPNIRLLSIPRSSIQLRGEFEPLVKPLVDAMLAKKAPEAGACGDDRVLIPVHEFQIPNVQERFKDAQVLPEENSVTAQALTSIRSVAIPDVLKAHTIKLCVGIKVSSALRTITPYTTYFGPGFSANVVPRLSYDRKILTIERELASAVYRHEDTDVAKHCSCVVRETIEHEGEINVVAASLVEKIQKPDTDETLSRHVWGLDTEEKRIAFLDRYIEYALKAFVPPCLENGVAFEAHGQNTMVRFDRKTGELKGFVIRDFGGVKVHNETLKSTCGVELDVLPDSCVVANTREECYKLLYHTLFHSQLQRLIRVLGLHHNGLGWEMVRKHFTALVPKDHSMYAYFMEQDKVPGKCLVRMKIQELYRDYIYEPVPNMILSRPQQLIQ